MHIALATGFFFAVAWPLAARAVAPPAVKTWIPDIVDSRQNYHLFVHTITYDCKGTALANTDGHREPLDSAKGFRLVAPQFNGYDFYLNIGPRFADFRVGAVGGNQISIRRFTFGNGSFGVDGTKEPVLIGGAGRYRFETSDGKHLDCNISIAAEPIEWKAPQHSAEDVAKFAQLKARSFFSEKGWTGIDDWECRCPVTPGADILACYSGLAGSGNGPMRIHDREGVDTKSIKYTADQWAMQLDPRTREVVLTQGTEGHGYRARVRTAPGKFWLVTSARRYLRCRFGH